MPKLRVLVVGASIAGPTAAYWFEKAGASVTIVERFPELRTGGQNVDIRTVGVTVMRRMPGVEESVRANVTPMEGIDFVGADCRSLGIIKSTGDPDQQSLVSEYEIYRAKLARILYDQTKSNDNIKYIFNEQIASMNTYHDVDSPVLVDFMNGTPSTQYDLVVACDGATSRTRALGFGCGVRDYMEPQNGWVAYCTIGQDLVGASKLGHSYSAVGGRFVGLGAGPCDTNKAVFMGFHPRGSSDAIERFREAMRHGNDAVKKFVASQYHGAGWKCDDMVKGMMESDDFYANEIVQIKPPSLYKGRLVLVGDAGYAPGMTGTGTSLALAGAYVLAGEIYTHPGDIAAGLNAYEETMRPVLASLQKQPRLVQTFLAPQTSWGLRLRNLIIQFVCRSGVLSVAQRLFAGGFEKNDKHALPDYFDEKRRK